MRCYYCGYYINDQKLETAKSSFCTVSIEQEIDPDAKIGYVCPRCGHLVTEGATPEDIKSLSQAAHAQLQRGRNNVATGAGFTSVGLIGAVIAVIFFILAKKPSNQYRLVVNCAEFYVFLVLAVISLVFLAVGVINLVKGFKTKFEYTNLLKEINNQTFIQ